MSTTLLTLCSLLTVAPADFFSIEFVDAQTGRGIPLVELKTVNHQQFLTDSNGLIALNEPGLMDQEVFFHIKAHGYDVPADGFGFRGKRFRIEPGGTAKIELKRINIAERLYRVTGQGIYRDSVLLGKPVPVEKPLLNAQVFGSDSVQSALFDGKIYWFWGDTNRPSYPLGNFQTPGATSLLPAEGGLDPDQGIDLDYFVSETGFAKEVCKMPGPGPTWIDGVTVLKDDDGRERMFAHYAKIKPPLELYEEGLAEFDRENNEFVQSKVYPKGTELLPQGHPFEAEENGTIYVYFPKPWAWVRVESNVADFLDSTKYETWTCLRQSGDEIVVARDANGAPAYEWIMNGIPLTTERYKSLLKANQLNKAENPFVLKEAETGKTVGVHGASSIAWNPYRKKWTVIALELFGTSLLGEIWYAESDRPEGPWRPAVKIVTHDKYSFYNPKQHPFFAKDNGRVIYFEGTYTTLFSGNEDPTPKYDYNQIMYRLDLDDPRLQPAQSGK